MSEPVAYALLILGLLLGSSLLTAAALVTGISLAGWLVASLDTAAGYAVFLAVCGLVLLGAGIVILNRLIERRISRIKDL